jgi:hypothetical protein
MGMFKEGVSDYGLNENLLSLGDFLRGGLAMEEKNIKQRARAILH